MSIRTKVLGLVDVLMRVPPIMVIDEILKIGMGLPTRYYQSTTNESSYVDAGGGGANVAPSDVLTTLKSSILNNATQQQQNASLPISNAAQAGADVMGSSFGLFLDEITDDSTLANILSMTTIKLFICILGLFCAACIFMLWTRHLVMVYMFVVSIGLTFLSYWSNSVALNIIANSPSLYEHIFAMDTKMLLDSGGLIMTLLPHLMAQWFMGMVFAYIHLGPRYAPLQKTLPLIFTSPILLAMLPLPEIVIKYSPVAAMLIPLILTKISLLNSAMEAGKTVLGGYRYAINFVTNFGLSALIENEWQRLNVPNVLRMFWTIRIGQGFIAIVMSESITPITFLPTMQKLLVDGCETLTAVLGMTSIISVICNYIGRGFQWYLLTFDNDEEKSLGTVSAVLFYILALQTGLTSLAPEKRFIRLCRNLCLLVAALLHFLHNIVSPILMSLSAARNPSRKRHIRALTVCAFLIIAPMTLLTFLWSRHSPSTWLLAVTAFSLEVIIKVLVSLATYTLFLLDARRQYFWEKLDDYLYYVRAFGNSVEFCFGILLFFNGAWILIFESAANATGGAIRAIMMCIHAYFNIWCEARAGWSVFMKRRSAVHKISALPEATPAQLQAIDDVCAICYQEMYSAKITRCRHFFHGVCLRKWLYVQDRCPLCHEIMMYTDKNDENDGAQQAQQNIPAEAVMRIYPRDDNNEVENTQRPQTLRSNSASSIAENTDPPQTAAAAQARNLPDSYSAQSSSTAVSVATAAASNSTHGFRLGNNVTVQE